MREPSLGGGPETSLASTDLVQGCEAAQPRCRCRRDSSLSRRESVYIVKLLSIQDMPQADVQVVLCI